MSSNIISPDNNYFIESNHFIHSVKTTLNEQSMALQHLSDTINITQYINALQIMAKCEGHIIVCGMGKSGHIGRKMSATFASTGTPSFFIHPSEAFHGDLGMITPHDVIILISFSGETDEVLQLIPSLKSFDNEIIAITGKEHSTLAKNSNATLLINMQKESCPNNLAPTTSTTLTTAIGDALASALITERKFMPIDFAKYHPGGSLGKKLLTKVKDVMQTSNLPIVSPDTAMNDVILVMTSSRKGIAIVCENMKLVGVITDGDLRRTLVRDNSMTNMCAEDVMNKNVKIIDKEETISSAEDLMKAEEIKQLLVVNDKFVEGIIDLF